MKPLGSKQLPAHVRGDRFFLQVVTVSDQPLTLFTDTGGGTLIKRSAAERAGLEVETSRRGDTEQSVASFPLLREDSWIPPISVEHDLRSPEYRGKFLVVEDSKWRGPLADGMLGPEWFAGRIWTFDYPRGQLWVHAEPPESLVDPAHTVSLGFLTVRTGRRVTHFPSVEASIDGESFAFLFDTGATVRLSDMALAELASSSKGAAIGAGVGSKEHATCFIVASIFDRWRARHPGWRVIENADENYRGAPMIEVPEVTIAGHTVGPVWFTRREAREFHDWLSQWTDRRVDGALGGSLFRYFTVTVDYPRARASFLLGVSKSRKEQA